MRIVIEGSLDEPTRVRFQSDEGTKSAEEQNVLRAMVYLGSFEMGEGPVTLYFVPEGASSLGVLFDRHLPAADYD